MRVANIAHLLAISGLHMGLLTGFVYGALRLVLALIPPLALRYPIRKWAAAGALGGGVLPRALGRQRGHGTRLHPGRGDADSGDARPARDHAALGGHRRRDPAVAPARDAVLAGLPDVLCRDGGAGGGVQRAEGCGVAAVRPAWQKWVFALVLSSLVAGLATAPFAAAHFNRIAVSAWSRTS
jgi:competence protein ComEC